MRQGTGRYFIYFIQLIFRRVITFVDDAIIADDKIGYDQILKGFSQLDQEIGVLI